MRVTAGLFTLLAASWATAKFFTPREVQQLVQLQYEQRIGSRAAADNSNNNNDHGGRSDNPVFKRGQYTIRPQNDTTCKSQGEKHWTGTIDISSDKRLFYWFFDSRSDPEHDPIIIWLNGGPGASSLNGFFQEMGPCWIPANSTTTKANPYSWNNKASVLFIDQPAGVGFSQLKPGAAPVDGDFDGGRDLQTFLNLFFKNVFPSRAQLPIYFAGESYGGHYVPAAMKEILGARERNAVEAFWGNITSLVLVSPVMEQYAIERGMYQLMCTEYRSHHAVRWNETVCARLETSIAKWDRMAVKCDDTFTNADCKRLDDDTGWVFDVLYEDDGTDTHNLDAHCYNQPYCDPPRFGSMEGYLNQPHILEALGFSSTYHWYLSNSSAVQRYDNTTYYVPMTDVISDILDATTVYPKHQKDPIRILMLNGNLDAVANTPGQHWFLEKLPWSGAAWWRSQEWREASELNLGPDSAGQWKASRTGQLVFVAFDKSGHMVPMDLPAVSDSVIRRWMEGGL